MDITTGCRNVAQRIINAEEAFIAFAMQTADLTRTEAERALVVMRKGGKRAPLKIDAIGGQFNLCPRRIR